MSEKKVGISIAGEEVEYEIAIGAGLLDAAGERLSELVTEGSRAAIVSNEKVFGLYGERLAGSLSGAGIASVKYLVPDGEEFKNLETAEQIISFLSGSGLKRHDLIVALGGGVVGDVAGFAASVYLRGLRCVQIPTTLLAMIDSSVGGKTGVNTRFGKNIVGTFHHPSTVLVDVSTLATLERREIEAGLYEAVKQASLSCRNDLESLHSFLTGRSSGNLFDGIRGEAAFDQLIGLVEKQVIFKAGVVSEDARESSERSDSRSRKILNFGHTTGHALERATNFRYFKHGEAVGYGILAAAEISKRLEICPSDSIDLLNDVVRSVGVLPPADGISIQDVLKSIEHDKKAGSNSVQWVLLEDIGKPKILSGSGIPPNVIKESIEHAISRPHSS
ncbi:MAG: 3-dehydroquinate synthase [Acidobacteria bacterium]|nr:MAG: 3-dehydroquinate synthase [Acidobacteriota bacterium]REK02489.1 MAG: 3-dehydroquinate synthase [Acidobacteriota bacterium]REK13709.1 MAG: 3-dehydroquinate synthase [Acidobacteriota bacterium]REK41703.1 MAG: 3-dehydroquinate synthase [Acidobacteriota bacterium]